MSSSSVLTARERVALALAHKEGDRIPIHDTLWAATIARWRNEGLPQDVSAQEYLGFELRMFGIDQSPMYPIRIIERTTEYVTETTPYGGVRRNHNDFSTTPELIDHAVKSRADWEAAKRRLEPGHTRVDWIAVRQRFERARAANLYTLFEATIGYDGLQNYIRTDELLPLLLTDPDWIRDMIETEADLVIAMARIMIDEGFRFDGAYLYDDLGYRNATFFSPILYRQLVQPADRRVFDFFHSQGMPVILHSCGNVKALIPDFIDVGLDCLQPLEVKAGMDVVELKREFGRSLAFMGGIDVRAMTDPDPRAIEREIAAKVPAAMKDGGFIFHSDHSIPNTVSLAQYRHVLECAHRVGQYR